MTLYLIIGMSALSAVFSLLVIFEEDEIKWRLNLIIGLVCSLLVIVLSKL